MVKRAITLGGGGPAAGLHIGVLEALAAAGIKFDVWALSCIGAWVGIVYNQFGDEVENKKVEDKDRVELTYQFFKNGVFRDDESYERFPINTVFGPDWRSNIKALNNFVTDRDNYKDFLWDPYRMMDVFQDSMELLFNRLKDDDQKKKFKKLDEGDINRWILNQAMATNPFVRYFTSMMYLSNVNGLSKINYPNSEFMKGINFEELKKDRKPPIFHNAWNLDEQKLALFSNREMTKIQRERVQGAYQRLQFMCVFGSSLHRGNRRDRRSYILRRGFGRHGQLRELARGAPRSRRNMGEPDRRFEANPQTEKPS